MQARLMPQPIDYSDNYSIYNNDAHDMYGEPMMHQAGYDQIRMQHDLAQSSMQQYSSTHREYNQGQPADQPRDDSY
jgi:hypothetical protein